MAWGTIPLVIVVASKTIQHMQKSLKEHFSVKTVLSMLLMLYTIDDTMPVTALKVEANFSWHLSWP